jgi:hypothetical protein
MAHPALYITSWLMTIPHFWAVFFLGGPLIFQWSYISGPCTSIWNHGCTKRLSMLSDRAMMCVGCLIDLVWVFLTFSYKEALFSLGATVSAVLCYVMAKRASEWTRAVSPSGEALTWKDIRCVCCVFVYVCLCLCLFVCVRWCVVCAVSPEGEALTWKDFKCVCLCACVCVCVCERERERGREGER